MPINRIAAQKVIERIPAELRTAARQERRALVEETKKDQIAASFMAAKGQIPFFNNIALKEKLAQVNNQIAAECYAIQNQGISEVKGKAVDVVKASSIL